MKIRRNVSETVMLAGLFILTGGFLPMAASAAPTHTVPVNCAQGQTIAHALGQGDERKPLVVNVQGTCSETVTIDRDDVTLQGPATAGSAVNGPDPAANTIGVTGSRVTISASLTIGDTSFAPLSSVVNTLFLNPVVPNTLSGVSPTCTEF